MLVFSETRLKNCNSIINKKTDALVRISYL